MNDYIDSTPVFGFLGAIIGLDHLVDNYGNQLKGYSLYCNDTGYSHALSIGDAVKLHINTGYESGLFSLDSGPLLGNSDLGNLSPLQSKCSSVRGQNVSSSSVVDGRL